MIHFCLAENGEAMCMTFGQYTKKEFFKIQPLQGIKGKIMKKIDRKIYFYIYATWSVHLLK